MRIQCTLHTIGMHIQYTLHTCNTQFKPKTEIGICCFSAKHAALRERVKTGWLRNGIMIQSGATCDIVYL